MPINAESCLSVATEVVLTTAILYVVSLVTVLFITKRRTSKSCVRPLACGPTEIYPYLLDVATGCLPGSGTNADVWIKLRGELGTSRWYSLRLLHASQPPAPALHFGQRAIFLMYTQNWLGELEHLAVFNRGSQSSEKWQLSDISVYDLTRQVKWYFPCFRWICPSLWYLFQPSKGGAGFWRIFARTFATASGRYNIWYTALTGPAGSQSAMTWLMNVTLCWCVLCNILLVSIVPFIIPWADIGGQQLVDFFGFKSLRHITLTSHLEINTELVLLGCIFNMSVFALNLIWEIIIRHTRRPTGQVYYDMQEFQMCCDKWKKEKAAKLAATKDQSLSLKQRMKQMAIASTTSLKNLSSGMKRKKDAIATSAIGKAMKSASKKLSSLSPSPKRKAYEAKQVLSASVSKVKSTLGKSQPTESFQKQTRAVDPSQAFPAKMAGTAKNAVDSVRGMFYCGKPQSIVQQTTKTAQAVRRVFQKLKDCLIPKRSGGAKQTQHLAAMESVKVAPKAVPDVMERKLDQWYESKFATPGLRSETLIEVKDKEPASDGLKSKALHHDPRQPLIPFVFPSKTEKKKTKGSRLKLSVSLMKLVLRDDQLKRLFSEIGEETDRFEKKSDKHYEWEFYRKRSGKKSKKGLHPLQMASSMQALVEHDRKMKGALDKISHYAEQREEKLSKQDASFWHLRRRSATKHNIEEDKKLMVSFLKSISKREDNEMVPITGVSAGETVASKKDISLPETKNAISEKTLAKTESKKSVKSSPEKNIPKSLTKIASGERVSKNKDKSGSDESKKSKKGKANKKDKNKNEEDKSNDKKKVKKLSSVKKAKKDNEKITDKTSSSGISKKNVGKSKSKENEIDKASVGGKKDKKVKDKKGKKDKSVVAKKGSAKGKKDNKKDKKKDKNKSANASNKNFNNPPSELEANLSAAMQDNNYGIFPTKHTHYSKNIPNVPSTEHALENSELGSPHKPNLDNTHCHENGGSLLSPHIISHSRAKHTHVNDLGLDQEEPGMKEGNTKRNDSVIKRIRKSKAKSDNDDSEKKKTDVTSIQEHSSHSKKLKPINRIKIQKKKRLSKWKQESSENQRELTRHKDKQAREVEMNASEQHYVTDDKLSLNQAARVDDLTKRRNSQILTDNFEIQMKLLENVHESKDEVKRHHHSHKPKKHKSRRKPGSKNIVSPNKNYNSSRHPSKDAGSTGGSTFGDGNDAEISKDKTFDFTYFDIKAYFEAIGVEARAIRLPRYVNALTVDDLSIKNAVNKEFIDNLMSIDHDVQRSVQKAIEEYNGKKKTTLSTCTGLVVEKMKSGRKSGLKEQTRKIAEDKSLKKSSSDKIKQTCSCCPFVKRNDGAKEDHASKVHDRKIDYKETKLENINKETGDAKEWDSKELPQHKKTTLSEIDDTHKKTRASKQQMNHESYTRIGQVKNLESKDEPTNQCYINTGNANAAEKVSVNANNDPDDSHKESSSSSEKSLTDYDDAVPKKKKQKTIKKKIGSMIDSLKRRLSKGSRRKSSFDQTPIQVERGLDKAKIPSKHPRKGSKDKHKDNIGRSLKDPRNKKISLIVQPSESFRGYVTDEVKLRFQEFSVELSRRLLVLQDDQLQGRRYLRQGIGEPLPQRTSGRKSGQSSKDTTYLANLHKATDVSKVTLQSCETQENTFATILPTGIDSRKETKQKRSEQQTEALTIEIRRQVDQSKKKLLDPLLLPDYLPRTPRSSKMEPNLDTCLQNETSDGNEKNLKRHLLENNADNENFGEKRNGEIKMKTEDMTNQSLEQNVNADTVGGVELSKNENARDFSGYNLEEPTLMEKVSDIMQISLDSLSKMMLQQNANSTGTSKKQDRNESHEDLLENARAIIALSVCKIAEELSKMNDSGELKEMIKDSCIKVRVSQNALLVEDVAKAKASGNLSRHDYSSVQFEQVKDMVSKTVSGVALAMNVRKESVPVKYPISQEVCDVLDLTTQDLVSLMLLTISNTIANEAGTKGLYGTITYDDTREPMSRYMRAAVGLAKYSLQKIEDSMPQNIIPDKNKQQVYIPFDEKNEVYKVLKSLTSNVAQNFCSKPKNQIMSKSDTKLSKEVTQEIDLAAKDMVTVMLLQTSGVLSRMERSGELQVAVAQSMKSADKLNKLSDPSHLGKVLGVAQSSLGKIDGDLTSGMTIRVSKELADEHSAEQLRRKLAKHIVDSVMTQATSSLSMTIQVPSSSGPKVTIHDLMRLGRKDPRFAMRVLVQKIEANLKKTYGVLRDFGAKGVMYKASKRIGTLKDDSYKRAKMIVETTVHKICKTVDESEILRGVNEYVRKVLDELKCLMCIDLISPDSDMTVQAKKSKQREREWKKKSRQLQESLSIKQEVAQIRESLMYIDTELDNARKIANDIAFAQIETNRSTMRNLDEVKKNLENIAHNLHTHGSKTDVKSINDVIEHAKKVTEEITSVHCQMTKATRSHLVIVRQNLDNLAKKIVNRNNNMAEFDENQLQKQSCLWSLQSSSLSLARIVWDEGPFKVEHVSGQCHTATQLTDELDEKPLSSLASTVDVANICLRRITKELSAMELELHPVANNVSLRVALKLSNSAMLDIEHALASFRAETVKGSKRRVFLKLPLQISTFIKCLENVWWQFKQLSRLIGGQTLTRKGSGETVVHDAMANILTSLLQVRSQLQNIQCVHSTTEGLSLKETLSSTRDVISNVMNTMKSQCSLTQDIRESLQIASDLALASLDNIELGLFQCVTATNTAPTLGSLENPVLIKIVVSFMLSVLETLIENEVDLEKATISSVDAMGMLRTVLIELDREISLKCKPRDMSHLSVAESNQTKRAINEAITCVLNVEHVVRNASSSKKFRMDGRTLLPLASMLRKTQSYSLFGNSETFVNIGGRCWSSEDLDIPDDPYMEYFTCWKDSVELTKSVMTSLQNNDNNDVHFVTYNTPGILTRSYHDLRREYLKLMQLSLCAMEDEFDDLVIVDDMSTRNNLSNENAQTNNGDSTTLVRKASLLVKGIKCLVDGELVFSSNDRRQADDNDFLFDMPTELNKNNANACANSVLLPVFVQFAKEIVTHSLSTPRTIQMRSINQKQSSFALVETVKKTILDSIEPLHSHKLVSRVASYLQEQCDAAKHDEQVDMETMKDALTKVMKALETFKDGNATAFKTPEAVLGHREKNTTDHDVHLNCAIFLVTKSLEEISEELDMKGKQIKEHIIPSSTTLDTSSVCLTQSTQATVINGQVELENNQPMVRSAKESAKSLISCALTEIEKKGLKGSDLGVRAANPDVCLKLYGNCSACTVAAQCLVRSNLLDVAISNFAGDKNAPGHCDGCRSVELTMKTPSQQGHASVGSQSQPFVASLGTSTSLIPRQSKGTQVRTLRGLHSSLTSSVSVGTQVHARRKSVYKSRSEEWRISMDEIAKTASTLLQNIVSNAENKKRLEKSSMKSRNVVCRCLLKIDDVLKDALGKDFGVLDALKYKKSGEIASSLVKAICADIEQGLEAVADDKDSLGLQHKLGQNKLHNSFKADFCADLYSTVFKGHDFFENNLGSSNQTVEEALETIAILPENSENMSIKQNESNAEGESSNLHEMVSDTRLVSADDSDGKATASLFYTPGREVVQLDTSRTYTVQTALQGHKTWNPGESCDILEGAEDQMRRRQSLSVGGVDFFQARDDSLLSASFPKMRFLILPSSHSSQKMILPPVDISQSNSKNRAIMKQDSSVNDVLTNAVAMTNLPEEKECDKNSLMLRTVILDGVKLRDDSCYQHSLTPSEPSTQLPVRNYTSTDPVITSTMTATIRPTTLTSPNQSLDDERQHFLETLCSSYMQLDTIATHPQCSSSDFQIFENSKGDVGTSLDILGGAKQKRKRRTSMKLPNEKTDIVDGTPGTRNIISMDPLKVDHRFVITSVDELKNMKNQAKQGDDCDPSLTRARTLVKNSLQELQDSNDTDWTVKNVNDVQELRNIQLCSKSADIKDVASEIVRKSFSRAKLQSRSSGRIDGKSVSVKRLRTTVHPKIDAIRRRMFKDSELSCQKSDPGPLLPIDVVKRKSVSNDVMTDFKLVNRKITVTASSSVDTLGMDLEPVEDDTMPANVQKSDVIESSCSENTKLEEKIKCDKDILKTLSGNLRTDEKVLPLKTSTCFSANGATISCEAETTNTKRQSSLGIRLRMSSESPESLRNASWMLVAQVECEVQALLNRMFRPMSLPAMNRRPVFDEHSLRVLQTKNTSNHPIENRITQQEQTFSNANQNDRLRDIATSTTQLIVPADPAQVSEKNAQGRRYAVVESKSATSLLTNKGESKANNFKAVSVLRNIKRSTCGVLSEILSCQEKHNVVVMAPSTAIGSDGSSIKDFVKHGTTVNSSQNSGHSSIISAACRTCEDTESMSPLSLPSPESNKLLLRTRRPFTRRLSTHGLTEHVRPSVDETLPLLPVSHEGELDTTAVLHERLLDKFDDDTYDIKGPLTQVSERALSSSKFTSTETITSVSSLLSKMVHHDSTPCTLGSSDLQRWSTFSVATENERTAYDVVDTKLTKKTALSVIMDYVSESESEDLGNTKGDMQSHRSNEGISIDVQPADEKPPSDQNSCTNFQELKHSRSIKPVNPDLLLLCYVNPGTKQSTDPLSDFYKPRNRCLDTLRIGQTGHEVSEVSPNKEIVEDAKSSSVTVRDASTVPNEKEVVISMPGEESPISAKSDIFYGVSGSKSSHASSPFKIRRNPVDGTYDNRIRHKSGQMSAIDEEICQATTPNNVVTNRHELMAEPQGTSLSRTSTCEDIIQMEHPISVDDAIRNVCDHLMDGESMASLFLKKGDHEESSADHNNFADLKDFQSQNGAWERHHDVHIESTAERSSGMPVCRLQSMNKEVDSPKDCALTIDIDATSRATERLGTIVGNEQKTNVAQEVSHESNSPTAHVMIPVQFPNNILLNTPELCRTSQPLNKAQLPSRTIKRCIAENEHFSSGMHWDKTIGGKLERFMFQIQELESTCCALGVSHGTSSVTKLFTAISSFNRMPCGGRNAFKKLFEALEPLESPQSLKNVSVVLSMFTSTMNELCDLSTGNFDSSNLSQKVEMFCSLMAQLSLHIQNQQPKLPDSGAIHPPVLSTRESSNSHFSRINLSINKRMHSVNNSPNHGHEENSKECVNSRTISLVTKQDAKNGNSMASSDETHKKGHGQRVEDLPPRDPMRAGKSLKFPRAPAASGIEDSTPGSSTSVVSVGDQPADSWWFMTSSTAGTLQLMKNQLSGVEKDRRLVSFKTRDAAHWKISNASVPKIFRQDDYQPRRQTDQPKTPISYHGSQESTATVCKLSPPYKLDSSDASRVEAIDEYRCKKRSNENAYGLSSISRIIASSASRRKLSEQFKPKEQKLNVSTGTVEPEAAASPMCAVPLQHIPVQHGSVLADSGSSTLVSSSSTSFYATTDLDEDTSRTSLVQIALSKESAGTTEKAQKLLPVDCDAVASDHESSNSLFHGASPGSNTSTVSSGATTLIDGYQAISASAGATHREGDLQDGLGTFAPRSGSLDAALTQSSPSTMLMELAVRNPTLQSKLEQFLNRYDQNLPDPFFECLTEYIKELLSEARTERLQSMEKSLLSQALSSPFIQSVITNNVIAEQWNVVIEERIQSEGPSEVVVDHAPTSKPSSPPPIYDRNNNARVSDYQKNNSANTMVSDSLESQELISNSIRYWQHKIQRGARSAMDATVRAIRFMSGDAVADDRSTSTPKANETFPSNMRIVRGQMSYPGNVTTGRMTHDTTSCKSSSSEILTMPRHCEPHNKPSHSTQPKLSTLFYPDATRAIQLSSKQPTDENQNASPSLIPKCVSPGLFTIPNQTPYVNENAVYRDYDGTYSVIPRANDQFLEECAEITFARILDHYGFFATKEQCDRCMGDIYIFLKRAQDEISKYSEQYEKLQKKAQECIRYKLSDIDVDVKTVEDTIRVLACVQTDLDDIKDMLLDWNSATHLPSHLTIINDQHTWFPKFPDADKAEQEEYLTYIENLYYETRQKTWLPAWVSYFMFLILFSSGSVSLILLALFGMGMAPSMSYQWVVSATVCLTEHVLYFELSKVFMIAIYAGFKRTYL